MKPVCQLAGTDGNAFMLIGKVSRTLKKANQQDRATEFSDRAFGCASYDELLNLIGEYVEVI